MKVEKLEVAEVAPDLGDPEVAEAVAEALPGRKDPFPLVACEVSFVVNGASSAAANALQRVMTQETNAGGYLFFSSDGFDVQRSTDPFTIAEYARLRIRTLRLRHGLTPDEAEGVELVCDFANDTNAAKDFHAGDLKFTRNGEPHRPAAPWFNPSHVLFTLQPGKAVVITKIRAEFTSGVIYDGASTAIRGRIRPLDLAEYPREETHVGRQGVAQQSGYVESSMTMKPRRFEVGATIPAVLRGSSAPRRLPLLACDNILMRLRVARGLVEPAGAAPEDDAAWQVSAVEGEAAGALLLRNESDTVVQLLKHYVNETVPDAAFIGSPRTGDRSLLTFEVRRKGAAEDLTRKVQESIDAAIADFTGLREELARWGR